MDQTLTDYLERLRVHAPHLADDGKLAWLHNAFAVVEKDAERDPVAAAYLADVVKIIGLNANPVIVLDCITALDDGTYPNALNISRPLDHQRIN